MTNFKKYHFYSEVFKEREADKVYIMCTVQFIISHFQRILLKKLLQNKFFDNFYEIQGISIEM